MMDVIVRIMMTEEEMTDFYHAAYEHEMSFNDWVLQALRNAAA